MDGLSICIPVYNYNCIASIKALCKQIDNLSIHAEVLIIDDASNIQLDDLALHKHPCYKYEKLSKNIGRSKIRNLLVQKAHFEYLLFIDGDSGIQKKFLKNYITAINQHPNAIICGGRVHSLKPTNENYLRHNYGIKFEDSKALQRNKKVYHSFMTNNFVSLKSISRKIPFNEKLSAYGQEDTFFGYELNKNNINVIHVDNPVSHLDIDSNSDFIQKTKQSIKNTLLLKELYPEFIEYSKLLTFINNYPILKTNIIRVMSKTLSKQFEYITKKTGNIYAFQLFKLFYTISKFKKE